ncbi:MAG: TonB-dependent receptor plug domain-containing protein, partial [Candidatus Rokuibacteriota bacterium]
MMGRGLVALLLLSVVAPARAQEAERLEPVVVTATRTEQRLGEAPASVSVLTREDLRQTAAQSLDDVLRQVPGFSLFRRSSSLVSHPTTQGVSLRGIGPSGASRALVLLDGIPINDPFGGWVYWNRVPLQSVEQVEVVRGGGASVWGKVGASLEGSLFSTDGFPNV